MAAFQRHEAKLFGQVEPFVSLDLADDLLAKAVDAEPAATINAAWLSRFFQ